MNEENSDWLTRLWRDVLLGVTLCLLAFNVILLLRLRGFGSDQTHYLGLVVSLMLLFNHIAFCYTKTGWTSLAMKTIAGIWMVFVFAYVFWVQRGLGHLTSYF